MFYILSEGAFLFRANLLIDVDECSGVIEIDFSVVAVAGFAFFVFGVTNSASVGSDKEEERVLFAVDVGFDEVKGFAGGESFDPKFLARGTPEDKHFTFK